MIIVEKAKGQTKITDSILFIKVGDRNENK